MKELILNMDTSMAVASISLSMHGRSVAMLKNDLQKDHAAWLHPAIEQMLRENGFGLQQLDAIAVTAGPGSYTGLRVSMAAAKGFCYILKIPLILINTLEVMAFSALKTVSNGMETLYCPMIDARRMEVFTALYDGSLNALLPPAAVILDENFDNRLPEGKPILVFGNGSKKYSGSRMAKENILTDAGHLGQLASLRYAAKAFTPAETAVPFYGKAFFTPPVK